MDLYIKYKDTEFESSCILVKNGVMFSFRALGNSKLQDVCKEFLNSRGTTILLCLNKIPFFVTIRSCSFAIDFSNYTFRDFSLTVENCFKLDGQKCSEE